MTHGSDDPASSPAVLEQLDVWTGAGDTVADHIYSNLHDLQPVFATYRNAKGLLGRYGGPAHLLAEAASSLHDQHFEIILAPTEPFPVHEDDDGIRPAGPTDACFYCHRKVGKMHGCQCVMVDRWAQLSVKIESERVGTYVKPVPAYWTPAAVLRQMASDTSGWCLDNILEIGVLDLSCRLPEVPEGHCLCSAPIEFDHCKLDTRVWRKNGGHRQDEPDFGIGNLHARGKGIN